MKKLLREDGLVLIVSVVIMYLAFRAAIGWDWHFALAALFAVVVGVAGGVVTQVVSMVIASKRSAPESQEPETAHVERRRTEDRETGIDGDDDGSASGTGAEESGPRGPVFRPEEYRSSLEDPD